MTIIKFECKGTAKKWNMQIYFDFSRLLFLYC